MFLRECQRVMSIWKCFGVAELSVGIYFIQNSDLLVQFWHKGFKIVFFCLPTHALCSHPFVSRIQFTKLHQHFSNSRRNQEEIKAFEFKFAEFAKNSKLLSFFKASKHLQSFHTSPRFIKAFATAPPHWSPRIQFLFLHLYISGQQIELVMLCHHIKGNQQCYVRGYRKKWFNYSKISWDLSPNGKESQVKLFLLILILSMKISFFPPFSGWIQKFLLNEWLFGGKIHDWMKPADQRQTHPTWNR